jgi:hypothetical protein
MRGSVLSILMYGATLILGDAGEVGDARARAAATTQATGTRARNIVDRVFSSKPHQNVLFRGEDESRKISR